MNIFPKVNPVNIESLHIYSKSLFICCEGFEHRRLAFIEKLKTDAMFSKSIVIKYTPECKSGLEELLPLVSKHSVTTPAIIEFNRFEPQDFENEILSRIPNLLNDIDEITIDISVMSKILIIILIICLNNFKGKLRIIYSEPMEYRPSQEEFEKKRNDLNDKGWLPSLGVHDIVRTTLTSSVVMQSAPSIVFAFTSFNEQLLRALLSVINPSHLFLLNGVPPHLHWRENATQFLNSSIINEFPLENPFDNTGMLKNRVSTLYYEETFAFLSRMYAKYCYSYRLIISPTGSKMQALACGLFKICCPDIHIEYPTPESLNFGNETGPYTSPYSSHEIRDVHVIVFDNLTEILKNASIEYQLNG